MTGFDRRSFCIMAATLAVLPTGASIAADDPWPELAAEIFGSRPLLPTETIVSLEAPYRAEDAALTPLTLRTALPAGDTRTVKAVTLVIDRNPMPLAATFTIGPNAGVSAISTRVRVNENTDIHAVAELSDGSLHVTSKFVKASGGCAAPASKNRDEAMASLGKMKLRQFPGGTDASREVQLMIRHPNNSGFQVDQVTHYYIPARYVSDIEIRSGDDLLLGVTGGISLSEDPNLRFTFKPNGAKTYSVKAVDTDQASFTASWPVEAAGSSGS